MSKEQIELHNIIAAEIGLGLPFGEMSGIGLIKNHREDRAAPIFLIYPEKLIGFDTNQAV
jgi:hypothetical protein